MSVSGKACFDCRALRTRPSLGRGGVEAVRSARPIYLPLYGPVRPLSLFCRPMGSPRRDLSLDFTLNSFANTYLNGHRADGGPLVLGGAISGNDRPRCSRRPPPVACGVARVLWLGQTGHWVRQVIGTTPRRALKKHGGQARRTRIARFQHMKTIDDATGWILTQGAPRGATVGPRS